jgi:hypothetical protein
MSWLVNNKEVINMILQVLIAIAALAIFAQLRMQKRATIAQNRATYAMLFSDINSRLSQVMEGVPARDTGKTIILNWYKRLFNEFEAIIFLANQRYLDIEMELYFRGLIVAQVDSFFEKYQEIASELPKDNGAYAEIREYYCSVTGKACPF